jgi:hypothetical protein
VRQLLTALSFRLRQHRAELGSEPADQTLWRFPALITLRLVRHLAIELVTIGADGYEIDIHS